MNPFSSWQEAWQQSSRHGIGVAADLTSDPQTGDREKRRIDRQTDKHTIYRLIEMG